MPRRARLALAGIPWHIIQRGNNRSACFYAEDDYRKYLDTLKEQAHKFGCAIHAYVLMTNHVHLLLTPARQDSERQLTPALKPRPVLAGDAKWYPAPTRINAAFGRLRVGREL